MGIFLLLLAALLWSFVGILVKTAATMVDSSIITLSRFLFGVLFLVIFIKIRDKKLTFTWRNKWILLGAIGKSVNYIFENIGISLGYAYGNVIVLPLQTIIMVLVSTFHLKEHLELKSLIFVVLCLSGALLISWNGLPLSVFFNTNLITT
ncbi:MAG: DMT family transporter, partial [Clostridiales bacterium]|nr:DMT family transporter [Clostridiales bacterium]